MLEIRLLGQFEVRLEGQPVAIPSRAAQSLLAYLVLNPRTAHRRERLAGLLAPEAAEPDARRVLRQALWHLRKALGTRGSTRQEFIHADDITIAFDANADYWLDVAILDRKVGEEASADHLMKAVAAYGGELLPGFYDEWLVPERERLQALFEHRMARLLERLIAEQRWPEVLEWAERWVGLGQAPEPAYRALMRAHHAQGDLSSVNAAYRRCLEALHRELGVEPSEETRRLYDQLTQKGRTTERVSPPASHLPTQRTPFVGRGRELAEIANLLTDPACRLLTLIGPGGIGKTRLALQAATERQVAFPDGAYFVALAPVSAAEFVVPTIANALQFRFGGPADPKEQLLNYLREKKALLVLDNFEHLLAERGAGLLSELLASAPRVKLLVTSRERLNLHEEWLLEVWGMRHPVIGQTPEAAIESYSAVQLFLQSVRRAQPGFALSEAETSSIVRICQLLGGMPLALELAAAWVRVLSCAEIAQEIEHGVAFLETTSRNAPERHRSLQAVFDHSWNLLAADEQRAFQNLSAFRGGFGREAAEQVAGASLRLLSALLDKSLLHRTAAGRYDMHELVRQYASERLQEAGEAARVRTRHLDFFTHLSEQAEPEMRGAKSIAWLSQLEAEHANLRAALEWSLENPACAELGLRLAGALGWFWHLHSHYPEGRDWLARTLSAEGASAGPPRLAARAKALHWAGWRGYKAIWQKGLRCLKSVWT